MIGNSFNLVDSIRGHLSDTFTNRLSLLLGESHEKTQTALHAAVPGLLSELDSAAATTDGANRLATAIDDSDDMVLDNFSGIFGKDFSLDSNVGTIRSVIGGGRFSEFTSNLGRVSGLSLRSITSLLGVLIPVVFGVIKRTMLSRAMKSTDITGLLSSQRANIAAALPTGMSRRFTEEPSTTSRVRRTEVEDAQPESNAGRWILPLAGIAAAIGLLWYLASRPTMHDVREARTVAERTIPSQELTRKYRSVIDEARSQGVQFSSVRTENGVLMLKGTAPSQEAVNKVWNEITRVNPKHDDIVADFSVGSAQVAPYTVPSMPARGGAQSAAEIEKDKTQDATRLKPGDVTKAPGAKAPMPDKDKTTTVTREKSTDVTSQSTSRTYTVKPGDTLGSISRHFYGNTRDYTKIVSANGNRIKNPDVIKPGEELMIPER